MNYRCRTKSCNSSQQKLNQYTQYRSKLFQLQLKDTTTSGGYDILLQAAVFSNVSATVDEMVYTLEKTNELSFYFISKSFVLRLIHSKKNKFLYYHFPLYCQ